MRTLITWGAKKFISLWLGVPVKDPTSGFRAFSREALLAIPLAQCRSKGPSIVEELLYLVHRRGCKIKEIPIIFRDRQRGRSTFGIKVLLQTLWFVLLLPYRYRFLETA